MLLVFAFLCGCDRDGAHEQDIAMNLRMLAPGGSGALVAEITVESSRPFRMVIEDKQGNARDAVWVSEMRDSAGESVRKRLARGRILIVASLVACDESPHDHLLWNAQLSSLSTTSGGASVIPVVKHAKLDEIVEVLATGHPIPRGGYQPCLRIQDRIFNVRVE
ncbi:MAG: hypothetical protein JSW27_16360 [Phycisphaerales bacterium]|nr:MAG: hypothetical protein JSW27_16360 [Phycisphaerales bacterium]